MKEEKSIEENLEDILDNENSNLYNFMTNISNQANLTNNDNISLIQLNSFFVVISPYHIEKFNIEGVDLDLKIDEEGVVTINNKKFEMVEIEPGIGVFGISKQDKE